MFSNYLTTLYFYEYTKVGNLSLFKLRNHVYLFNKFEIYEIDVSTEVHCAVVVILPPHTDPQLVEYVNTNHEIT